MGEEFWNSIIAGDMYSVDLQIDSKKSANVSVRDLTDKLRTENALQLPVEAGTKVVFAGGMGAYLSYDNPPVEGDIGEVVTVKSAGGDITHHEGKVFIQWDDGKFRSIHAEHLRPASDKKASRELNPSVIRVSSLGDLTQFLKRADGKLIHKSTNDLWSYSKDADGNFLVERLFDDEGEPLKG